LYPEDRSKPFPKSTFWQKNQRHHTLYLTPVGIGSIACGLEQRMSVHKAACIGLACMDERAQRCAIRFREAGRHGIALPRVPFLFSHQLLLTVRSNFRQFLRIIPQTSHFWAMEQSSIVALAKKRDFHRKYSRQEGNEHRFPGVFLPQVGKPIPFTPKNGGEP
jgi:hypothetical protein